MVGVGTVSGRAPMPTRRCFQLRTLQEEPGACRTIPWKCKMMPKRCAMIPGLGKTDETANLVATRCGLCDHSGSHSPKQVLKERFE